MPKLRFALCLCPVCAGCLPGAGLGKMMDIWQRPKASIAAHGKVSEGMHRAGGRSAPPPAAAVAP